MKFKVGDRVEYTSGIHGASRCNPLKNTEFYCKGTVTESDGPYITVDWDNGIYNSYSEYDLSLLNGEKQTHKLTKIFS